MSIGDYNGANPLIPADRDWPLFRYTQWRTANDRDPRLVAFEDKLALKALARDAGVPTVPTLAVIDVDALDLDGHPALQLGRFVIKSNHGWNDIVFVERLAPARYGLSGAHINGQFDTRDATDEIRRHFRWWIDCFESRDEWAVDQIARRQVFAEPWLPLTDDYKVQVVGGRALSGPCPQRALRAEGDVWRRVRQGLANALSDDVDTRHGRSMGYSPGAFPAAGWPRHAARTGRSGRSGRHEPHARGLLSAAGWLVRAG